MSSLEGSYLVAPPYLPDDNFFRSVVLLVEHDQQGAVGVILNRPTSDPVNCLVDLFDEQPGEESSWPLCDDVIHFGGPVEGPLMALHGAREFSERQLMPGVYFSSQKDNLRGLFQKQLSPFRFFNGYSGWAAGQLESELEAGGWFVLAGDSCSVFENSDDIWERLCASYGMDFLSSMVRPDDIPVDPGVN